MDQPSEGGYELLISKMEKEQGTSSLKSTEYLPCALVLSIYDHAESLQSRGDGDYSHFADRNTESSGGELTCSMPQN